MASLETVQNVLNEVLDIDPEEVTPETSFDELGIDSLDMAELISTLEDEMDIEFGEPQGLETIGELVEYLDSL